MGSTFIDRTKQLNFKLEIHCIWTEGLARALKICHTLKYYYTGQFFFNPLMT